MKTTQVKWMEAKIRNSRWAALTKEQKINILKTRPGKCAKQLQKLESQS